jgi:hypothetical protein
MGAAGWWQGLDPGGVLLVQAWCLPLVRGVRRSVLGDRWLAVGRNAATESGLGARPLTDAQQGRRQLPAAAAQGGRHHAGAVAGTG